MSKPAETAAATTSSQPSPPPPATANSLLSTLSIYLPSGTAAKSVSPSSALTQTVDSMARPVPSPLACDRSRTSLQQTVINNAAVTLSEKPVLPTAVIQPSAASSTAAVKRSAVIQVRILIMIQKHVSMNVRLFPHFQKRE